MELSSTGGGMTLALAFVLTASAGDSADLSELASCGANGHVSGIFFLTRPKS